MSSQIANLINSLSKLNESQKIAVINTDGPMLVLAGPGTGKTQTIALRIGHILMNTDLGGENILCLTFSNAGVESMKKRLNELIGKESEKILVHFTY